LFQDFHIEVNQKADGFPGQFHVGQKLRLVDREQPVYAFQFKDDGIVYQHIDPVSAGKIAAFVLDRQGLLELKRDALGFQFVSQALFVCRFEKARAQVSMDFNCTADDGAGKFIEFHDFFTRQSRKDLLFHR